MSQNERVAELREDRRRLRDRRVRLLDQLVRTVAQQAVDGVAARGLGERRAAAGRRAAPSLPSFTRLGHGTSTIPHPAGGGLVSGNGSVRSASSKRSVRSPAATCVTVAVRRPTVSSYCVPVGARMPTAYSPASSCRDRDGQAGLAQGGDGSGVGRLAGDQLGHLVERGDPAEVRAARACEPSATTTARAGRATITRLRSASGRLTLVIAAGRDARRCSR